MVESPGPVLMELTDPRRRVLRWPGRGNSVPAAAAETLWILAGRNDVAWLSYYLKRAPEYADDPDKAYWRAGYGPRLRRLYAEHEIFYVLDQLDWVVEELHQRPNSRRAIITLHSPIDDAPCATKIDFPCNQSLMFMMRNGALDLTVTARSQDLLFGWFTNFFEFTVIQELVAEMTGLPLGRYYALTNNLHYYPEFAGRFEKMRSYTPPPDPYLERPPAEPITRIKSISELQHMLGGFFAIEGLLRGQEQQNQDFSEVEPGAGCLVDLMWSVFAYAAAKSRKRTSNFALSSISDPTMRQATAEAIQKEFAL